MMRLQSGSASTPKNVRASKSLLGTTKNATCASAICLRSSRNSWKITSSDTFRVTEWCITGSTCTIWKNNESEKIGRTPRFNFEQDLELAQQTSALSFEKGRGLR